VETGEIEIVTNQFLVCTSNDREEKCSPSTQLVYKDVIF